MVPLVRRVSTEPVIAAGSVPGYGPIFNAGVVYRDGLFHLFARGVRDGYRRNHGAGPASFSSTTRVSRTVTTHSTWRSWTLRPDA